MLQDSTDRYAVCGQEIRMLHGYDMIGVGGRCNLIEKTVELHAWWIDMT